MLGKPPIPLLRPIAAALGIMLCCTGCLGGQELADRAMVTALGVDAHPRDEGYLLTFAHYGKQPSAGQQLTTTAGDTISQGLVEGSVTLGKELFLGSVQLLILGEDLTPLQRQSVTQHLYSIYKITPKVTVASAQSATEVMAAAKGDTELLTQAIFDGRSAGKTVSANLETVYRVLSGEGYPGQTTVIPFLAPTAADTSPSQRLMLEPIPLDKLPDTQSGQEKQGESQDDSSQSQQGEESQAGVSSEGGGSSGAGGSAAGSSGTESIDWLYGGRLITSEEQLVLSAEELKGLCWISNSQEGAVLSVPTAQGLTAIAVAGKVEKKNRLSQTGDAYVLNMDVTVPLRLLEGAYHLDDQAMQNLSDSFAAAIRRQIQLALSATLRQGLDVLSLRKELGVTTPEQQWPSFLQDCGFAVNVSVILSKN